MIKQKNYFLVLLAAALGALVVLHFMPPVAALLVLIFAGALLAYEYFLERNNPYIFYPCWVVAIIIGVVVGLYRSAGFSYPLVFNVTELYEGGAPMALYLNTAKAMAGYCIVFFLASSVRSGQIFVATTQRQVLLIALLAALVLLPAYLVLNLQVHIKTLDYILAFGAVNLLTTCIAEEAFMRWLLQAQLHNFLVKNISHRFWQNVIPLILATIIFVLTHAVSGLSAITIYALAGFIYGLAYTLTRNLLVAIAVHFLVNIIHFSFFTYPVS